MSYFMGKNTPDRQDFIIDNLRVEKDLAEEVIKEEQNEDLEKAS